MSSLSLHKTWRWPVCHTGGPWSCLRGAGSSACAFQGEQQPGTLLPPRDRQPEGAEGKPQPGTPITNRSIPPQMGISSQHIRPCPDVLVFLSQHLEQAHVPVPGTKSMGAHTGHCQENQTDWAHEEFACQESGRLK